LLFGTSLQIGGIWFNEWLSSYAASSGNQDATKVFGNAYWIARSIVPDAALILFLVTLYKKQNTRS
jgi:hypothetical protein